MVSADLEIHTKTWVGEKGERSCQQYRVAEVAIGRQLKFMLCNIK